MAEPIPQFVELRDPESFVFWRHRDDALPLAVLTGYERPWREARAIAVTWAAAHPDACGYIMLIDPERAPPFNGGAGYYAVREGVAWPVAAAACQPRFFEFQEERSELQRLERLRWRRHPACPYCTCHRRKARAGVKARRLLPVTGDPEPWTHAAPVHAARGKPA
jgi:hypothetical protein